ncbi:MAG: HD domain-containing protein [Oscillospiraceae bacterium]|nr:HD domain-containing protein [Oscillospiraceae bacterium]
MKGFSKLLITDYQEKANLTMAFICRIMTVFLSIAIVLNALGIFKISGEIYPTIIASIVILLIPTVLYNFLHLNYLGVRYFVLTLIVLMSGILYSILSYHVIIMLVFPVVISCLYCDTKSVMYASFLSVPVMIASHLVASQLRIVPDEPLVELKDVWLYGILPRVIEFAGVAIICITTAQKIQKLINQLAEKNDALYREQETLVTSLAEMIEAQSQETGKHVKRVSEYTRVLCEALGMSDEEVWEVSSAAALHDVGKIMVPQDIINKPGKLTDEEFAIIKTHVQYGRKLLEKCQGELMHISADIAYHHHERYDGKGYMGVKGEDINIYARCVSVADVFDALVSRRPYKKAWSPEEAKSEILSQRGKQFDPNIVDLFEANYDKFLTILQKYPDNQ